MAVKRAPTPEQAKTYGRWVAYSFAIPVAFAVTGAEMTANGMSTSLPPALNIRVSWPAAACTVLLALAVHVIGAIHLRRQWGPKE